MTFVTAVLLYLSIKVTQAVDLECRSTVTCSCGSEGVSVTVCVPNASLYEEVCTSLSKCENCDEGFCSKCLEGLGGPFCSQEKNGSREKRQAYYSKTTWRKKPRAVSAWSSCPNMDGPKFGSIRCVSSNERQTCTGKCLPGYRFVDGGEEEMVLSCQNGKWTPRTSFPACKSGGHCDLIVEGAGSFNCTTSMDGTRCDVTCYGSYVRRYFCYPGRNWEPALPSCVKRKNPVVHTESRNSCTCKNGEICDRNGQCMPNSCRPQWTRDECMTDLRKTVCSDPGQIANGNRLNMDGTPSRGVKPAGQPEYPVGHSLVFTCNPGYALERESLIRCEASGKWSKQKPYCRRIPVPTTTTTAPTPKKKFCPDPGFVEDGYRRNTDGSASFRRSNFEEGESIVYACMSEEYELRGSFILTCRQDGTWSRSKPTCMKRPPDPLKPVCPDPGQIANGNRLNIDGTPSRGVKPAGQPEYPVGHSLVFTCDPGYALERQSLIRCEVSGRWSKQTPYCRRIPVPTTTTTTVKPVPDMKWCRDPRVDPNGIRDPSTSTDTRGFPAGTQLSYSCQEGYDLVGRERIFCLVQGHWSADRPRCVFKPTTPDMKPLVYCSYPGDISDGRVFYIPTLNRRRGPSDEREDEYPEGSRLQYSCNDGFKMEGADTITCQNNGRWSSVPPKCRTIMDVKPPVFCQYPGDISNGQLNFVPTANNRRGPADDSGEEYPVGTRLRYSCDDGFQMEGSDTLTCRSDGRWSTASPRCKIAVVEVSCPNPGSIPNGQVVYRPAINHRQRPGAEPIGVNDPKFPLGSRLRYTCNSQYALVGRAILVCLETGSWSADKPVCSTGIKYCEYPGDLGNGQMVHYPPPNERRRPIQPGEQYPAGSRMGYECNEGYVVGGPSVLLCDDQGSWSDLPPTCITAEVEEIMYCENLGPLQNGRVQYFPPAVKQRSGPGPSLDYDFTEYPEGAVLQYDCYEGYRLIGQRSITCQSSSHWSSTQPICEQDCGRSFVQTVFNGKNTTSGDWPWMVSIHLDDRDPTFICGGALLNSHTVITAAHCLEGRNRLLLRFGKHHFNVQRDDMQVLTRKSSQILIHPDYSNVTYDSDIGLVTFKPRLPLSHRVQPICLPTLKSTRRNLEPGQEGYVCGWGETERALPPESMMVAKLPVVSDEACNDEYRHRNLAITQLMFCAGYEDGRQNVCNGDSGSPFVFYDKKTHRFILEGLVSYGARGQCGISGRYTIFTKVFEFMWWISERSR